MEGVPYRSTMNKKIDKAALASRILALEGISSEDKSALLELLSEQKRYGLVWEDSPEEVEALLREKLPVLTEDTTKRILSPLGESEGAAPNHILIEGDNYPALVALQYAYEGKIDVIYIDPPYNTGNKDFVYNDSYVDSEDSYRHSKWLSFMSKRLRIAKRLLSDRGVVFISIDDNEQANLKLLCDEVFGGRKMICNFIWQKKTGAADANGIATITEYILVYCMDPSIASAIFASNKEAFDINRYKFTDQFKQIRGPFYYDSLDRGSIRYSDSLNYPIYAKDGTPVYPNDRTFFENDGWTWKWSEEKVKWGLENGFIEVVPNSKKKCGWSVKYKIYLNVDNEGNEIKKNVPFKNLITDILNSDATNEIKDLFGQKVFSFPKPVKLIKKFISNIQNNNSIVLDFFAGSGTTLHATMQLNAEDGGHRQCILVTNNENNICEEVTYERNKRVIQGYTTPKGQQVEGLKNNNLRYYKVDFVDREKTAANQKELMKASTDLLCIKENLYQEETCFEGLKLHPQIARYFTDGKEDGGQMLVIYEPNAIPVIVKRIEQMPVGKENKLKVYVMAEGQYPYTEDFETVLSKVELRAMPHALYQAMRQVLPLPAEAENTAPDREVSDEETDGSIYKSEEL